MFAVLDITNILAVLFLVFLEGVLSLDNALVLALVVKHLPPEQQRRALTWGIWGAFAFRFVALFFLIQLMRLMWIKAAGAVYLFFIAVKGLLQDEEAPNARASKWDLWRTILLVELLDIAFSADSILAAVSLTQSYWIVLLGGLLGIVMMRFAAVLFIRLIHAFPRMATTAYLLVLTIAAKLLLESLVVLGLDFHDSKSPEAWLFWFSMVACIAYGFRSTKRATA